MDELHTEVRAECGGRKGWPVAARVDDSGRQVASGPLSLSEEQLEQFAALKARCADVLFADEMKLSNDDVALRFLIARNFDVEKAEAALRGSMEWRRRNDVNEIFAWSAENVPHDVVMRSHQDGLCGFYGFCTEGYPVFWDCFSQAGLEQLLAEHGMDTCTRWHHTTMERMREHAKLLQVDRFNCVVDLRNVSARAIVMGKIGTMLKTQMKQDQEVYPECMRRMFIVNAPYGFSTVWNWAKVMLDSRVQEKITVDGKRSAGDALSRCLTPKNVPVEFGGEGKADWTQCRPVPTAKRSIFRAPMYLERLRTLGALSSDADADGSPAAGHTPCDIASEG